MSKLTLGDVRVLPIDDVRPYWRNPRRVPEEAVNALMESLRTYGYQQPIVVDAENEIVIGHTRYAAMRRLGYAEVMVVVADLPAAKISQLRVIDNRAAEFSSWDFEALVAELEDFDAGLLTALFPEVHLSTEQITAERDAADDRLMEQEWDKVVNEVGFVCPSCYHEWEMTVSREDILSGHLEIKEQSA